MKPLPENYQDLTASEKLDPIWENVESSIYHDDQLPQWGMPIFLWDALTKGLFSKKFLTKTLMTVNDEMPDNRKRLIHTYGTMCKICFESNGNHPFTGIFESGAQHGLIRISLTLPAKSFTPGFGIKLLVDGQPSRNVPVIPFMNGQQDDHNVFRRSGRNHVTKYQNKILFLILMLALKHTVRPLKPKSLKWHYIPLDAMSSVHSDGTVVDSPNIPYQMSFLPTPEAQLSRGPAPDYRIKLKSIKPGTRLYDIVASESEESTPIPIGCIRSTSDFVASEYGDKTIFFQHDHGVLGNPPK